MKEIIKQLWLSTLMVFLLAQCSPSEKPEHKVAIRKYTQTTVRFDTLAYREKVYVPTYSEIYASAEDQYFPLLTSLSVRNTSLTHPMYVKAVDYYDTEGKQLKAFLAQPIVLKPLQSVEFPVTQKDQGGAGANFIVDWGSSATDSRPVIQAVMIGTAYQQGISFLTEGKTIETTSR